MKICDYGCGKEAKFQLKNNKFCCSKFCNSCDNLKKINSEKNKGKKKKRKVFREKPLVCDYGCGKEAKFWFKSVDKW